MSLYYVCSWYLQRPEENVRFPETRTKIWVLELKPRSSVEQPVLITAESSFWHFHSSL